MDGAGNVYIADFGNQRVLKETPAWSGSQIQGFVQSTVAPNSGTLEGPRAVAVDGSGNVYVADSQYVYKETPSASGYIQSTVAPFTPIFGVAGGVAVDGNGNVYVAGSNISAFDAANQVVKETPMPGGSYSPTVVADDSIGGLVGNSFVPYGVAVDGAGNVYIVDNEEAQVLKMTPASGGGYNQILIANGNSPYGLASPLGLAVDALGNVLITAVDMSTTTYSVLKEDVS